MIRFLKRVFRSYSYAEKIITALTVIVFLLMILKMMIFPYGLFGFGEANIYTEAIVSKNGFQSINPLFVDYNEADREVAKLIFSGLMKYDPVKRAIVDDLATLNLSEDKKTYTFIIKEGIKWHDGTLFTADDVYFTYHDLIMNASFPNQILKANFTGVTIEKTSPNSVKFALEKPNIFFISSLVIGILPQHKLKGVDPYNLLQDDFNKLPIGTGPFIMKEPFEIFADGHMQVTLNKNSNFYGEKSEVDILRINSYLGMEDLINDLNSINAIVKVSGNYVNEFKNNPRFTLFSYELPQYTAIFMNMETEFLKIKNVRLALQKAIDKNELLSDFVDKKPVDTPLLDLDQSKWEYQYNIDEARGALKDTGFLYAESDVEKTGVRYNADKKALELRLIVRLYPQGSQLYEDTEQIVAFLQQAWEKVGFQISVEFLYAEEFEDKMMKRDYDLLLIGQNLGYNLDTYAFWHSTQANPNGQNFSNYKSFAVDSLIIDLRETFDSQKKQDKLNELAKQIREDFPAIFLYRPVYYYVSDGKIKGINMDGIVFPSDRFTGMSAWEFDK